MKSKRGFTMVELLAVIAIVAVLAIIVLPNVLNMFNDAKKNTFETELKNIYGAAEKEYVNDSLSSSGNKVYSFCKNGDCGKDLKLNGGKNIEYYIEFSSDGKVTKYYATNGAYQYRYDGPNLKKSNIKNAEYVPDLEESKKVVITKKGAGIIADNIVPSVSEESFLMEASYGESDAVFLRTNIVKRNIEKVTFTNTLGGHSANGTDCWDVSVGENGSVLAWAEDTDSNGKYEITIGAEGKVYMSSGKLLFHRMSGLKTIDGMQYLDTSQVTSMYHLFFGCWSLENVDLSYLNTSKVTDMIGMFGQCYKFETIDVSHLDTSKVTNFNGMFENCINLKSIDISTFDLSSATYIGRMFWNCEKLTSITTGNIDTSNVTGFSGMFEGCKSLETVDVGFLSKAHANNFSTIFKNCINLKNIINLDKLYTNDVTNMSEMFYGCSNLEVIDLSNFNTANVTNMYQMFENCPELKTIYASDNFVVTGLTASASDQNMFYKDEKLVGGSGTTYDNSRRNKTYAHIDGGVSNPGYFTRK